MKKLIWTDNLNTGIDVIDNQHKRIVDYINKLYSVHNSNAGKAAVKDVIDELVDYTLTHFAFEEGMLDDYNYGQLSEHRVMHEQFAEQVRELRDSFDSSENASIELNNLMVTWLFNHILHEDAKYVPSVPKSKH
ncbi:MAG: bacteriohemerythrin [Pseudomonadota bacterium]